MDRVLISWIGGQDLHAAKNEGVTGPILPTLKTQKFDRVVLLCSYPKAEGAAYLKWLHKQLSTPCEIHFEQLDSPVDFPSIYRSVDQHLSTLHAENAELSILLSPGTPAMQSVWILLGKTKYPARFYQSSKEKGVEEVTIPFEISAEYTPSVNQLSNDQLAKLANDQPAQNAAFNSIITQNPLMLRLKQQAQILAERDVPVLIQGETGTGKELFARAIHNSSSRAQKPFVAVNCGAFPAELVDSILFGHKKGAFTGATHDKQGVFQQAHEGTLFLDEFGELEPNVQVRLLRVLQEGVITPIGAVKEEKVNVRIITATHRNLLQAIQDGNFREDLFYRTAIGVLTLPPLRERQGDIILLAESLLAEMAKQDKVLKDKKISSGAKNIILSQSWPGNIRELRSTLLRASLWSVSDELSVEDIQQSLFEQPNKETDLLARDISQGIDIQNIISDLVKYYIPKTLAYTNGSKSKAAELLGFKNYQTLTNWMDKYDVK